MGLTLEVGGFAWVKGCYTYKDGSYSGKIYYGTGADTSSSIAKNEAISHESGKYRPLGFDCSGNGMSFILIRISTLKNLGTTF